MTRALAHLLCLAALAQQQSPPDQIKGIVVDASTGEPVRKAELLLNKDGGDYAISITGADGRFLFHSLPHGRYTVEARKPGWIVPKRAKRPAPIEIGRQDAEIPECKLVLARAASISGRVLDPEGDPLARAVVQLLRLRTATEETLRPVAIARTDDRGHYRLQGIPPGRYLLQAALSTDDDSGVPYQPRADGLPDEALAATYYPDSPDRAKATPVSVDSGQDLEAFEIRLSRQVSFHIRGRLQSGPGKPGPGVVFLRSNPPDLMGEFRPMVSVRPDGAFAFSRIPPGRYTLGGSLYSPEQQLPIRAVLDVSADLNGLVLEPQPLATLRGKLAVPEGAAMPRARLGLHSMGDDGIGQNISVSSGDGAFVLQNVWPGTYEIMLYSVSINVKIATNYWISAVMQGTEDVTEKGVLVSGVSPEPIVVQLDLSTTSIKVRVVGDDGAPLPRASVFVARIGGSIRHSSHMADVDGLCTIAHLAPGEYRLYAMEEYGPALPDSMLEGHKDSVKSVKLTKGETASLELKAIPLD